MSAATAVTIASFLLSAILVISCMHLYDGLTRIARALETLASCVTPKEEKKP